MKYPAYPQYKDSGVAWLGEVPGHWNISPLKHSATIKTGYAFNSDDFIDEGIPVLRIGEITKEGNIDFSNAKCLPVEYGILYRKVLVQKDDIVMAMTGATIGKAGRYSFETPGLLNQRVCLFRPVAKSDQNFLWYTLNTRFYAEYIALTAFGGAQPNISDSSLLACVVPLPPSTEQTAIADFLDRETRWIDTLVAKKRKLVELLKEKRSALISRTVTCGLPADAAREFGLTTEDASVHEAPANYGRGDFNRPQAVANQFAPTDGNGAPRAFKDSGVEWLGEVPAHWAVKRLKMATHLFNKKVEAVEENPLPYIGMENIESWSGKLLPIDPDIVPSGVANYFSKGTTLFGKLRPYLAKACNPDFDGLCSTELLVIQAEDFDRHALLYWLLADGFIKLVDSSTYGSKMPRANWDFIGNCQLPIPPLPEQTAIATYLDRETAKIDRLLAKVETAMARLQEYRSALITAAVTGKIDVRGLHER